MVTARAVVDAQKRFIKVCFNYSLSLVWLPQIGKDPEMVEESEKVISIHDRPELPSPLEVVLGNKDLHDKLHNGSGQPGGGD